MTHDTFDADAFVAQVRIEGEAARKWLARDKRERLISDCAAFASVSFLALLIGALAIALA